MKKFQSKFFIFVETLSYRHGSTPVFNILFVDVHMSRLIGPVFTQI